MSDSQRNSNIWRYGINKYGNRYAHRGDGQAAGGNYIS